MTRRESVAIHEAGHAVVGWLFGEQYGCRLFTVDGLTGGLAGEGLEGKEPPTADLYVDVKPDQLPGRELRLALHRAAVCCAGCVAVGIACNSFERLHGPDLRFAMAWSKAAFPNSAAAAVAFVDLSLALAHDMLLPRMPTVRKIAEALDRKGILSPDECCALIWPNVEPSP